ncbi:response regulator receiver domain [Vibrio crassostreae]|uniref:response regulator receiver domain n=1 Tax=Vibrio crassostreae TaxID=246167 RepID=UPI001B306897|nr:response regulator receiver domain [Vibrio crassostreae]
MTNLIKEAYIDPIRSVIVVDDEYPTVLELLDGAEAKAQPDVDRLKDVIALCRDDKNSWTLDIDNGQSNVLNNFSRISHSDLLILDYHLEKGNEDGKGEQALKVIDDLVKNQHFNLVIVHTKGYTVQGQDIGDLNKVFADIVLRLFGERTINSTEGYDADTVEDAINTWADDDAGVLEKLERSISTLDCLRVIKSNLLDPECNELKGLKSIYDTRPLSEEDVRDLSFSDLLQFVVDKHYTKIKPEIGTYRTQGLNWCATELWVKTSNSFIVVVGKDTSTADLPNKLLESLVSWNPHPHALLLSKFRNLVDEQGFGYVDDLINKRYVQAGWLQELLRAGDSDAKWVAQSTSERLLSTMSEKMVPDIGDFAHRIQKALLSTCEITEVIEKYHHLNTSDKQTKLEISKNINAYSCSKSVVGNQLVTGHILDISGDKYICLTPACDLVPAQKNDWKNKLGKLMPFKLVKLWPSAVRFPPGKGKTSDEKLLSKLNANEHVVFNDVDIIKCYSLLKADGANPQWEQAFAHDNGEMCWGGNEVTVCITRLLHDGSSGNYISNQVVEGRVVTQLRYEYAINLLQKFGVTQSRVGLDFVEFR